jgi:hypothetical protein
MDPLKANGTMRGKHSAGLAGPTSCSRGHVFSGGQPTGHFLQRAAQEKPPITGLRHCAERRSGTRIHGQCLPAVSPVLGRCVVKYGGYPGCARIVGLESERPARRTMLANQDDVFPATDRLHFAR